MGHPRQHRESAGHGTPGAGKNVRQIFPLFHKAPVWERTYQCLFISQVPWHIRLHVRRLSSSYGISNGTSQNLLQPLETHSTLHAPDNSTKAPSISISGCQYTPIWNGGPFHQRLFHEKMESLQNKHLRALLKRPAFLYHDTNSEVREMIGASSIQACITQRRLLLFKRMTDKPTEHLAAFAVLWGKSITSSKKQAVTPWTKQLFKDIVTFCHHHNTPPPSSEPQEMVKWMCQCSKSRIKQYTSILSSVDPKIKQVLQPQPLPALRCPMCSYVTNKSNQLTMHLVTVHKYRNIVSNLIKDPQCPVCLKRFRNIKSARTHYFRKCTFQVPERLIQTLLIQEQQRPMPNLVPTQSTLHQFFTRKQPIA